MKISRSVLAIVLGSLATVSVASAAPNEDDLVVTASVTDTCILTGGTLDFGVYDTVVPDELPGTGEITVACTAGAVTYITLGQGNNPDGGTPDAPARRMKGPGLTNYLTYSLYSDVGASDVWGDTQASGLEYLPTDAQAEIVPVYGRLHANQDVPAGAYTDTVLATVHF